MVSLSRIVTLTKSKYYKNDYISGKQFEYQLKNIVNLQESSQSLTRKYEKLPHE